MLDLPDVPKLVIRSRRKPFLHIDIATIFGRNKVVLCLGLDSFNIEAQAQFSDSAYGNWKRIDVGFLRIESFSDNENPNDCGTDFLITLKCFVLDQKKNARSAMKNSSFATVINI